MRYAENTSVSVERTRAEIEATVSRYGATAFHSGWRGPVAYIEFELALSQVRFTLTLPDKKEKRFTEINKYRARSMDVAHKLWEQACRQLWRALLLVIKAKLEAVAAKIVTFEHEFLAHVIMPNGMTIGEALVPRLPEMRERHLALPMMEAKRE